MPIIKSSRLRVKELFIITVKHHGHHTVIEFPEGTTPDVVALHMSVLKETHKPLTQDTTVADVGPAEYRIWKLAGSVQREDVE